MKKLIAILLVLGLLLALGACSKGEDPAATKAPDKDNAGSPAPEANGGAAVSDTNTVAVGAVVIALLSTGMAALRRASSMALGLSPG